MTIKKNKDGSVRQQGRRTAVVCYAVTTVMDPATGRPKNVAERIVKPPLAEVTQPFGSDAAKAAARKALTSAGHKVQSISFGEDNGEPVLHAYIRVDDAKPKGAPRSRLNRGKGSGSGRSQG